MIEEKSFFFSSFFPPYWIIWEAGKYARPAVYCSRCCLCDCSVCNVLVFVRLLSVLYCIGFGTIQTRVPFTFFFFFFFPFFLGGGGGVTL